MKDVKRVKLSDLVSANSAIERIHRGMREGHLVDKERLATLINTCLVWLEDTITSVDKGLVTETESKDWSKPPAFAPHDV